MTVPYRKKLIEVGLPLVAINAESAREKSIRHGHPSTLHLWWARRPLAACRAVLFSSLVDDPDSDPAFHKADGSVDEDRAGLRKDNMHCEVGKTWPSRLQPANAGQTLPAAGAPAVRNNCSPMVTGDRVPPSPRRGSAIIAR
jgi:adenine-specific DNA methylase